MLCGNRFAAPPGTRRPRTVLARVRLLHSMSGLVSNICCRIPFDQSELSVSNIPPTNSPTVRPGRDPSANRPSIPRRSALLVMPTPSLREASHPNPHSPHFHGSFTPVAGVKPVGALPGCAHFPTSSARSFFPTTPGGCWWPSSRLTVIIAQTPLRCIHASLK